MLHPLPISENKKTIDCEFFRKHNSTCYTWKDSRYMGCISFTEMKLLGLHFSYQHWRIRNTFRYKQQTIIHVVSSDPVETKTIN